MICLCTFITHWPQRVFLFEPCAALKHTHLLPKILPVELHMTTMKVASTPSSTQNLTAKYQTCVDLRMHPNVLFTVLSWIRPSERTVRPTTHVRTRCAPQLRHTPRKTQTSTYVTCVAAPNWYQTSFTNHASKIEFFILPFIHQRVTELHIVPAVDPGLPGQILSLPRYARFCTHYHYCCPPKSKL